MAPILGIWAAQNYTRGLTVDYLVVAAGGGGGGGGGHAARRLQRRELAAAWYERAHQLDPEAFRWLYYLGSLQILQGKRAEATATLRAALNLDPGYLRPD
jgi:tetratricopeptide (TPR) repeat protein